MGESEGYGSVAEYVVGVHQIAYMKRFFEDSDADRLWEVGLVGGDHIFLDDSEGVKLHELLEDASRAALRSGE